MDIEYRWSGRIAVIHVAPEAPADPSTRGDPGTRAGPVPPDASAAEQVASGIQDVLRDGTRHVVFDLSRVDLPTSALLGWMVAFARHVREQEGVAAIAAPAPSLVEALSTTGIEYVFRVFRSADDAVIGLVRADSESGR